MGTTIYVADDEKNIRDLLTAFLTSDGYTVRSFSTGDALVEAFGKKPCHLVILDIMMPGTDGLEVCEQLRHVTRVPIIILTAKDSELDYVRGIALGGDDYLTKPFKPTVLLMRVRALLRRVAMDHQERSAPTTAPQDPAEARVGDLVDSRERNAVLRNGRELPLTPTELRLLSCMLAHPGRAFSRRELLEKVWGHAEGVETRVTDETVRRLRRKLAAAGSQVRIRTVWGHGYRIDDGSGREETSREGAG